MSTTSSSTTSLVNTVAKTTKAVEDTTILFARQIPIKIYGESWIENSRMNVYFDGELVTATPTGETSSITDGDGTHLTVNDDQTSSIGTFTATIMVPAETRTGEHTLTFEDIDHEIGTSAIFTSSGISRLITESTLITRNLQINRNTTINRTRRWSQGGDGGDGGDPIAQSFVFKEGKTFSGINLYFQAQSYDTDAWCEIGYLVNGYPSQESVFHRQVVPHSSVNTSANGTQATRIDFTKPIYIPADSRFFITFGSDSPEYYVYASELGEQDLETQSQVIANPYLQGVFFQSSNNNTWTAFQTMDLTCDLFEGRYETTGSITTENTTGLSVSSFLFEADEIIPDNTFIKYYYSTDNGVNYNIFNPGMFKYLSEEGTQLKFRMDMTGTGKVTPLINCDSYSLVTSAFNVETDNYYITRSVTGVPAYNNVRIIYDIHNPTGCSINVEYSADGATWYAISDAEEIQLGVDDGIDRYSYSRDITIDGLADETYFRARIKLNNSGNPLYSPIVKNLKYIMKV
jgi:hypothetical protein